MAATLTIEIPDELAAALCSEGKDLSRSALEVLAVEAYRSGQLSHGRFRKLLGLEFNEAEALLKKHQVWLDYTVEDFEREGEATRRVIERVKLERSKR